MACAEASRLQAGIQRGATEAAFKMTGWVGAHQDAAQLAPGRAALQQVAQISGAWALHALGVRVKG